MLIVSIATASYRLLPSIILTRQVVGPMADKLARCFPKGVIKVQDVAGRVIIIMFVYASICLYFIFRTKGG